QTELELVEELWLIKERGTACKRGVSVLEAKGPLVIRDQVRRRDGVQTGRRGKRGSGAEEGEQDTGRGSHSRSCPPCTGAIPRRGRSPSSRSAPAPGGAAPP